MKKCAEKLFG